MLKTDSRKPAPLTDEEVRLRTVALESLRTTQDKEHDTLAVPFAKTSEEKRLRANTLYQHLMAEAQHRRRVGRQQRFTDAQIRRHPTV